MERLGLDINDEVERYEGLQIKLEEFIDALFYYELEKSKLIKNELSMNEEYYSKTNLVHLYHIYFARYFLLHGDSISAQQHIQIVEKNRSNLSPFEELLFQYIYGSSLYYSGKVREALDYYLSIKIKNVSSDSYISMKELSYQIALCYSVLSQSEQSIPYAQEALVFYKEKDNYIRTIHTQMLLAINYESLQLYHEAQNTYQIILRNTQLLNLTELYHQNLFNYALLLNDLEKLHEAIKQFKRCIDYFPSKSDNYYIAHIELIKATRHLDSDTDKCSTISSYVEKIEGYQNANILKQTKLLIREVELQLQDNNEKLYNFYEKEFIPFFLKEGNVKYAKKYILLLAEWYEIKEDYKTSSFHYNKYCRLK